MSCKFVRLTTALLVVFSVSTGTVHAGCPREIDGLYDCARDEDCVVANSVVCCPCSMGGRQAAVNRLKARELRAALAECCSLPFLCTAEYACGHFTASFFKGKCKLTDCGKGTSGAGKQHEAK